MECFSSRLTANESTLFVQPSFNVSLNVSLALTIFQNTVVCFKAAAAVKVIYDTTALPSRTLLLKLNRWQ